MSFSYAGPATSPTDAVRFWLQDVNAPGLFQNEDIDYIIDLLTPLNGADPMIVAAYLADILAGRYAGEVTIVADGVNYSGDQLAQKYTQLAESLRNQYNSIRGMGATPYVGGIMIGDPPPASMKPHDFAVGQDDNPWAGRQRGGHYDDDDGELGRIGG